MFGTYEERKASEERRKTETARKAAAFIAAVQAVMKEHEVTEFSVEMESGSYEYKGAHMSIQFAGKRTENSYEYFDAVEFNYIESTFVEQR